LGASAIASAALATVIAVITRATVNTRLIRLRFLLEGWKPNYKDHKLDGQALKRNIPHCLPNEIAYENGNSQKLSALRRYKGVADRLCQAGNGAAPVGKKILLLEYIAWNHLTLLSAQRNQFSRLSLCDRNNWLSSICCTG
jgi:hypothetical protein